MNKPFVQSPAGALVGSDAAGDYARLMNSMQVSVSKHILDAHFSVVWSNPFYYQLIRYSQAEYEALFQNRPDLYYPYHHYEGELEKISRIVTQALREEQPGYNLTTRMPVKGGGHVWVQINGVFTKDEYNGYPIAYTVMTNIDDFVKMQQAQSITYNNIPGFVAKYLIRDYLHIDLLEANEQFTAFFGAAQGRCMDDPHFRRNVEANREQIIPLLGLAQRGEHVRFMCKLQNRAGKTVFMQTNGDCVDWIDGAPVYLLTYIDVTDLTELRDLQEKLEAQKRDLQDALTSAQKANAAKQDFLSRMSHEIRTPLNAIIGMAEIAAARLDDRDRMKDCLEKISISSAHLLSLVNDILDMSKIDNGKLAVHRAPFSLKQVLDSVAAIIRPQAAALGIDFHVSVRDVAQEELLGDAMRLKQILINLLSNAVKFTPKHGQVRLRVKQLAGKADEVRLRFTVSDTGRGMSEAFVEQRLFNAFEQEDGMGGTGLGMPITKNLVTLLGGVISVKSKLGEGTIFTVDLPFAHSQRLGPPLCPDVVGSDRRGAAPTSQALAGRRILVVEDNDLNLEIAEELLKMAGAEVCAARNGRQALDWFLGPEGRTCAAILMDIQMPEMDGYQATRAIRSADRPNAAHIPIIAMTANAFMEDVTAALAAGMDAHIAKPIDIAELYQKLEQALA